MNFRYYRVFFVLWWMVAASVSPLAFAAEKAGGDGGLGLEHTTPPERVVSLSPAASEVLSALGVSHNVVGVTTHDRLLPGLERVPMVGSFLQPSLKRILELHPDCVVIGDSHAPLVAEFVEKGIPIVQLATVRLSDAGANILQLGMLMHCESKAEALVTREKESLQLVAEKIARLDRPPVRVMRLMGIEDGKLLVPGDDSFQNDMIQSAGGQAPVFGATGQVITINAEQLKRFNPEVIYCCGMTFAQAKEQLQNSVWSGVAAVEQGRLLSFPCDLVCRVATQYGAFCAWLAAELYGEEFTNPETQVTSDQVLRRTECPVSFDYIDRAEVLEARLFDFPAKTLVISFKRPQQVLSSLSGWGETIQAVGNHYSSPPSWPITHLLGLERSNTRLLAMLGLAPEHSSFLYTGADMANLVYVEEEAGPGAGGVKVGVFATAGVLGNAMRTSVDTGNYVEPGTINMIIMVNRSLTPGGMTRALITATEAKTAALEDLDIRSSYSGVPATGTGTDNILVVGGSGARADLTGGHSKLGEVIGRAVYKAVLEAIWKQNRLYPGRAIFQRFEERQMRVGELLQSTQFSLTSIDRSRLAEELVELLLEPRFAAFVEMAFVLSDSHERGGLRETSLFDGVCLIMAQEISGKPVAELIPILDESMAPFIIRRALNALLTGLLLKE